MCMDPALSGVALRWRFRVSAAKLVGRVEDWKSVSMDWSFMPSPTLSVPPKKKLPPSPPLPSPTLIGTLQYPPLPLTSKYSPCTIPSLSLSLLRTSSSLPPFPNFFTRYDHTLPWPPYLNAPPYPPFTSPLICPLSLLPLPLKPSQYNIYCNSMKYLSLCFITFGFIQKFYCDIFFPPHLCSF